jgi:hypothetical protein
MATEETDYKVVLENAKADLLKEQENLGECLKQQENHEKKIAGLRATIAALARMLDETFVEEDAIGFTDAVREAFKSVGTSGTLTAMEVKAKLESMGYDTRKYGNVMASIHTIIARLASMGEIKSAGSRADNKPCYQTTGRFTIPDIGPIKTRKGGLENLEKFIKP